MKTKVYLLSLILSLLWTGSLFSQSSAEPKTLGLPGDNLDLFAVLDLFQKSQTIEDFEKSLNDVKSKINNLDLDKNDTIDFIKVSTTQNEKDFTFVLQVPVSKTETQDVAVILVSKDKDNKVSLQIVGDPALYGKDYIVEPKATASAGTANPGYSGTEPVTANITTTSTVYVESSPIIVYVYSPAYVPYYPPYYRPIVPIAVGIYCSNHHAYPYHGGGYGNTTVIVNNNNYNNYNNNSRNTSNTVNRNNPNAGSTGNKPSNTGTNTGNKAGNTAGNKATASPSTQPSQSGNKAGNSSGNKATASPSAQPSQSGNKATASPSTQPANSGNKASASPSTSGSSNQSAKPATNSRPTNSSGSSGSRGGGGGGGRGGGGRR